MTATSGHSGTTAMQWCAPFGVLTPASWMSLNAARYMSTYGATSEDFGRAVVQLRDYASTNPAAWVFGRPITLEEHQASRWVAEPAIRLFDCCQETDGAVALVVTSLERASEPSPTSVVIAGDGLRRFVRAGDCLRPLPDRSIELAGAAALGRRVFAKADLIPDEIDVAMIYDAFTPILMMQLEAYGFCSLGRLRTSSPTARWARRAGSHEPQWRAHRGGIHSRPQPDGRGRPSASWKFVQPGVGSNDRARQRQSDRRRAPAPLTTPLATATDSRHGVLGRSDPRSGVSRPGYSAR